MDPEAPPMGQNFQPFNRNEAPWQKFQTASVRADGPIFH
jgi:hypothetical protein